MVIENSKDLMRVLKNEEMYEVYASRGGIEKILSPCDVTCNVFGYHSLEAKVEPEEKETFILTCASTSKIASTKGRAIFETEEKNNSQRISTVTAFTRSLYGLTVNDEDMLEEKIELIPFYDSDKKERGKIYLLDNFPDKFSEKS